MVPKEVQNPPNQENAGHHGTPGKQAPEGKRINWDEWPSGAICSKQDCEDEAAKQNIISVAGMTKSQTAEDELSHAGPGVEAAAVSMEATQADERLGLDAPDSLQSGQNTPGDHEQQYLPFASQHKLMCYMQQYLDGVCYEFGKRTMPEVLKKRDWDCVEAAQLESWLDEFTIFFEGVVDKEVEGNLFRSLADVQRIAICRVRTDSTSIKEFLLDAVRLTRILGVGDSYMVMDQFREAVERTLGNMHDEEDQFRSQLRIRLLQFQRQREVIDVQEKLALSEMEKGLGECQAKAGIEVLGRIKKAEEVLVIKTS